MVVEPAEKTGLCHGGACPRVERGFESTATLPLFCQRGDNPLTFPYLAAASLLLLLLEERSGWKSPCETGGMLLALSGGAAVGRAPCAIWAPLLLQRAPSWERAAWAPGDAALPSCTALAREAQPCFGMGWEQTGKKNAFAGSPATAWEQRVSWVGVRVCKQRWPMSWWLGAASYNPVVIASGAGAAAACFISWPIVAGGWSATTISAN